jgi:hypothetical protein
MSDSPRIINRGKIVTVYVPIEMHEGAKRMKAAGIIPSISSLLMDGYRSIYESLTEEQRRAVDGRQQ